jgi:transketolase
VPFLRTATDVEAIRKGAYVFGEPAGGVIKARAVIIATGSEMPLAVEAQKALAAAGVPVRVVSMPSTTVFDRQSIDYKASVLPAGIPRVAIEAGVTDFWWKYVRAEGAVIGIDRFGESAPAGPLFKHFGFTVDNVVATVNAVIAGGNKK